MNFVKGNLFSVVDAKTYERTRIIMTKPGLPLLQL